jgi:hypothetical protein
MARAYGLLWRKEAPRSLRRESGAQFFIKATPSPVLVAAFLRFKGPKRCQLSRRF